VDFVDLCGHTAYALKEGDAAAVTRVTSCSWAGQACTAPRRPTWRCATLTSHDKIRHADIALHGDLAHVLSDLKDQMPIAASDRGAWRAQLDHWEQRFPLGHSPRLPDGPLKPQDVVEFLSRASDRRTGGKIRRDRDLPRRRRLVPDGASRDRSEACFPMILPGGATADQADGHEQLP
jgi:hypothetical protein